jgi:hypothetical protein
MIGMGDVLTRLYTWELRRQETVKSDPESKPCVHIGRSSFGRRKWHQADRPTGERLTPGNLRNEDPSMEPTRRETELYEACDILITESRRVRLELEEAWGDHFGTRLRTTGYSLSLLDEAMARLAAQERVRAERAHRVIEDMF